MVKSKAKKVREHAVRNGRLDPSVKRGNKPDFSMHVRNTPSKVERIRRAEKKYKGTINL